ncbi:MAG: hypothetical protein HKN13_09015 [Rhodothermales bacterium]|nr:hypothetical protein [Rhodothermales bacterium]
MVLEGEFRYPGPKPNSKETGILMLADSCEAASRSLESPTHKRLESLIDSIFDRRIQDGQLDDSDLTFRELDQIKDTFLSMLVGMYHVRVKYPDQEKASTEDGVDQEAEPISSTLETKPTGVEETLDSETSAVTDDTATIDSAERRTLDPTGVVADQPVEPSSTSSGDLPR